MLAPRYLPASLSLLATGLVAAFTGTAHAGQSCNLDADCGHGFACQVVGGSACPGIACPEGAPCPTLPPCTPMEFRECVPASCNAHSDCADGMVCIESTAVTTCPTAPAGEAPACPPNTDCKVAPPPPAPSDCTTVTVRTCTPRYELPCANEASCGTGFNCVADQSCTCSGGSGTATPGTGSSGSSSGSAGASGVGGSPNAGAPAPPPTSTPQQDPAPAPTGGFIPPPNTVPPPDCTCTPSTTKHCEPKAVTCNADSDCPATWTCVTIGTSSAGCAPGAACDVAPPTTTFKQCRPPYYSGGSKGGIDIGIPQTGGTTGGGTTGGTRPPTGTGTDPIDPRNPEPNPGPTTGGEVGNNGDTDSNHGAASDDGSCQMAVCHASTTGASLLALLGIAGMARRRRTRWG